MTHQAIPQSVKFIRQNEKIIITLDDLMVTDQADTCQDHTYSLISDPSSPNSTTTVPGFQILGNSVLEMTLDQVSLGKTVLTVYKKMNLQNTGNWMQF